LDPAGSPASHPDDAQVLRFIRAARQAAENYCAVSIGIQDVRLSLDYWPSVLELPLGPVRNVSSVKYFDAAGVLQTLDAASYHAETGVRARLVILAAPGIHPTIPGAVQINYSAGYGDDVSIESPREPYPLPGPIRDAILLELGNRYENREQVTDVETYQIGRGWADALQPYRLGLGL
jgi:uncharacterized phiE125 gp8 family phage protein